MSALEVNGVSSSIFDERGYDSSIFDESYPPFGVPSKIVAHPTDTNVWIGFFRNKIDRLIKVFGTRDLSILAAAQGFDGAECTPELVATAIAASPLVDERTTKLSFDIDVRKASGLNRVLAADASTAHWGRGALHLDVFQRFTFCAFVGTFGDVDTSLSLSLHVLNYRFDQPEQTKTTTTRLETSADSNGNTAPAAATAHERGTSVETRRIELFCHNLLLEFYTTTVGLVQANATAYNDIKRMGNINLVWDGVTGRAVVRMCVGRRVMAEGMSETVRGATSEAFASAIRRMRVHEMKLAATPLSTAWTRWVFENTLRARLHTKPATAPESSAKTSNAAPNAPLESTESSKNAAAQTAAQRTDK